MKNISLLIHPEELSYNWINGMVENGITTLALHPWGGKIAHKSMADLLRRLQDPSYRELLDYAAEQGLRIEYEMHAARYLLPAELFDSRPEWFRVNAEGERSADWNCCPSCTEALDYMAERTAEVVKQFPHFTGRCFFWLDDAKDSHCHCEKCQGLSASDQQLIVMNHILRRLRQDDPDVSLAYLAYFNCIECPEKVAPEKGIFLEYAPFERDFHRPLQDDAQSEPLTRLLSYFGQENARALDYWYDNSMFSKWKKPPVQFKVDAPVLRADIDYYEKLGFTEFASFACFLGEDYEELYGAPDLSDLAALQPVRPYKNVIFDFSDTLYHWKAEDYLTELLSGDKERAHRLHEQITTSDLWLDYNLGNYNSEEANAAILDMLAPEDRDVGGQYLAHWHEKYEPNEGIPELVRDLQARGIKLYILSVHTERFEMIYDRYELLQSFDGRLISYEVGLDKRDPEFYKTLLRKYDLKAEECMYFDDHAGCAAGGRAVGINAHRFVSVAAARRILGM